MVSEGYNYDTTGSTCGFTDPTDVTNGPDPQLQPLAYNDGVTLDFAPVPSSPLVDAVPLTDTRCTGFDQTLVTVRPQNDGCEIGAVEVTHAEGPESDPGPRPAGPAPQTPTTPQLTG